METTRSNTDQRYQTWVITEHRQITVSSSHPFVKVDAMRIAFGNNHMGYVISDHVQRNAYPINTEPVEGS